MGILSSYLFLFIGFYAATYKKDGKRTTGRKAARSLKDAQVPDIAALTHGKIERHQHPGALPLDLARPRASIFDIKPVN
jgi:fatty acid elongase 2/fatty acid elongase 3